MKKLIHSANIEFYIQDENKGKTLEYDLMRYNPAVEMLVADSMSNKDEIKALMKLYKEGGDIDQFYKRLSKSQENTRISEALKNTALSWSDEEKKIALIAARYLNSVGKGVNALELAYVLQENLNKKGTEEYIEFVVPDYIKEAIDWVCEN